MKAVVVGAGPAGIRAVEQLVRAGVTPIWIDEAPDGGGRITQRPPAGFSRGASALYGADSGRARRLHATLDALKPRTDWRPDTLVWNIRPEDRVLHTLTNGAAQDEVQYDALILCTGAMDRVLPLPGWTLPGVTSLGGAQVALKSQGVGVGANPVLIGTGPLLWLTALQYAKAGAKPAAVLDTTDLLTKARFGAGMLWNLPTLLRGMGLYAQLKLRGVKLYEDITPLAIEGVNGVTAVHWRDAAWKEHVTPCDAVAMGWGLKPEAQLADLAGVPFDYDGTQQNWVPRKDAAGRSPVAGVYLAGDGAGIGGVDVAELGGARAALALLADAHLPSDMALTHHLDGRLRTERRFRAALEQAFPYPARLAARMDDSTSVCRCEVITAGELRRAAAADAPEMNRAKAFSRVGMGRCQGRLCGTPAAAVLARELQVEVPEVGRLRGQPPVKPVPLQQVD
ncbi:NAD(P)/FAD-dependent oxidoreductase [Falsiroseomonas tokyonensis]|uniref:FAD-dependent oxidoreductase n=1 Tax=Falsiroseomonas tokyonensis TaxID=430521 RepID=A0ABV7C4I7_9PROT|nr:FAD/NAD(P)-binding oxidoreductase [Falsiroseomonas tokyonensis]MBU8541316.1 NAD(P)/FAD-dependent oxidoreductase [Falsiroseomonas tokyonensis]